MICINCFHAKTKTTNSRSHKTSPSTWRRRFCPVCKNSFTTYERATEGNIIVHSQHEDTSPFHLGRLIISISRSFQHNPTGAYASYDLAITVYEKLLLQKKQPTESADIAKTVLETLRQFDKLAALQYAAQHGLVAPSRGRPAFSYADSDHSVRQ